MKKFSGQSKIWWDFTGPMRMLYNFNQIRVPFICDGLLKDKKTSDSKDNLTGFSILDAGCGGGLLSESLANLGAQVTGVDPNENLIKIAKDHQAENKSLSEKIDYICDKIEDFAPKNQDKFDAVVSSEVLEHIDDPEIHLTNCVIPLKPGGSIFVTTWNKTYLNWLVGILFFENVFGTPPKGCHEYNKCISPEDVSAFLEKNNCKTITVKGTLYNPITQKWSVIPTTKFCYILHAIKETK